MFADCKNGDRRWRYRAWRVGDNVIRCIFDRELEEVLWEIFWTKAKWSRFSTDVIRRDEARAFLRSPHYCCDWKGNRV